MPHNLTSMSVQELLSLWAGTMTELQARDILRTNNNPVGDLAEAIVHEHFGGTRGSFAQKGWDVLTDSGERVQVKGVRQAGTRTRRNVSPIRDAEYDSVVIVMFDADFQLTNTIGMNRAVVEKLFSVRTYVNGRIITVTDKLLTHPEVQQLDMTEAYQRVSRPRGLSELG
ncbi:hypothetical protein [Rhodococcus sp. 15-649-2-2]|uniref:DUF6998 domain-containing protein n=1 Tax=Rhodococcus sp. 15-649-2-2 TaxID=2023140 RepID=UPI00117AE67C|nr:hypothetical protein [Rhodococcus sp. 15-649-2-2]